ncbi:MAG: ImmA/IrrE family metallo-endopeptidase [Actinobacteria bacterium]|jgi:Zn-dependent peptidase ImmA (M78 family)/DNA-binding XRE family transcriptional regulator|nr:ImmA/IrrE family metallo-endopeptidase [Actinomycetota bacterium]
MFNAARLTQARLRRGWTKVALADAVGLTARRIASFENEGDVPPESTIAALAAALRFPVEFFTRGEVAMPRSEQVSFRSLSKLTAGRRDAALAGAALAYEVASWFDDRFELPEPDLPDLRDVQPSQAAAALRSMWNLGELPAPNLVHLLEAHGVRVFSLVDDCADLDALSMWNDGTPFVFLTQHKSPERARWDAAHELGHLVLHLGAAPQGRVHEDEADAFARHFLLPERGVLSTVPRRVSLDVVRAEKVTWKVSALAYIRQLHNLDHLTEWQYKSLIIEASQAGYRRTEGDIDRERSQLIPKVLDALREEGITMAAIADDLAITTAELRGLLFSTVVPVEGSGDARPSTRARLRLV